MLEGAPAATRARLRRGWSALGVRLGPATDDRRILGWAVRRSSPEFAVLAASSLIGMEAEVVCKREPRGLLVATFMQLKNPVARTVWAVVSPRHRRVLDRKSTRLNSSHANISYAVFCLKKKKNT